MEVPRHGASDISTPAAASRRTRHRAAPSTVDRAGSPPVSLGRRGDSAGPRARRRAGQPLNLGVPALRALDCRPVGRSGTGRLLRVPPFRVGRGAGAVVRVVGDTLGPRSCPRSGPCGRYLGVRDAPRHPHRRGDRPAQHGVGEGAGTAGDAVRAAGTTTGARHPVLHARRGRPGASRLMDVFHLKKSTDRVPSNDT